MDPWLRSGWHFSIGLTAASAWQVQHLACIFLRRFLQFGHGFVHAALHFVHGKVFGVGGYGPLVAERS
jgi:hypothetical protein